jgi:hypothetical protein
MLYSHFDGRNAVALAVMIEGFADLAVQMRQAQSALGEPIESNPCQPGTQAHGLWL